MKREIEVCIDCPYNFHPCPEGCSKIVKNGETEPPTPIPVEDAAKAFAKNNFIYTGDFVGYNKDLYTGYIAGWQASQKDNLPEEESSLQKIINEQNEDLNIQYQQLYETRLVLRKIINAFTKSDDKQKKEKAIEQGNYILNKDFDPKSSLRSINGHDVDWTKTYDGNSIDVPDNLMPLFNKIGTQLRLHVISGKDENLTIAHMIRAAQVFFKQPIQPPKTL